jgi:hypothetical protein
MTVMDHQQHELDQTLAAGAPAAWSESVVIGSEDTAGEGTTGTDDRFGQTEIGVGDVEAVTTEDTDVTYGLGAITAAAAVEANDGDIASRPDDEVHQNADSDIHAATEQQDAADAPATPTDGGDDVPPEIPATAETGEQPNRGEALRKLIAHTGTSETRIHNRIRNEVIGDAERLNLNGVLEEYDDYDLDEAVEYIATTGETEDGLNIRDKVLTDDVMEAQAEYAEALEAAGARFMYVNGQELTIQIADPATFTEAVEQLQAANLTADELYDFDHQIFLAIEDATIDAHMTISANNQLEAIAICQGEVPDFIDYAQSRQEQLTSTERTTLAANLAANAGRLVDALDALGTPARSILPLRQLAVAHSEGLDVEWAVGSELEVVGAYVPEVDRNGLEADDQAPIQIGIDRIEDPEDWQAIYGYLTHLEQTAPDAAFTDMVRSTLLGDLYSSMINEPEENWQGELPPNQDTYQATLSAAVDRIITIMPRE